MDTRTPPRSQGGRSAGIGEPPELSTIKVPSDPVRIGGSHVSFRVRLGTPVASLLIDAPAYTPSYDRPYAPPSFAADPFAAPAPAGRSLAGPSHGAPSHEGRSYGGRPFDGRSLTGDPAVSLTGAGAVPRRKGRVTAVTWSGQAGPEDTGAIRLLDTARLVPQPASAEDGEEAATRVLPRIPAAGGPYGRSVPAQGGHRTRPGGPSRPGAVPAAGWAPGGDAYRPPAEEAWAHAPGDVAQPGRYPGRKVDLGLVLLPLRVFLGCISVYAGFSKLCDPVYFDGGDRGSMMRWLSSLHPWSFARPLLDLAMAHPVGAGLAVAFVQIVVGVLSVLGLWQRAAAAAATLLSATLLLTVSWRTVPVYDAPHIVYLAAWSPLLIAGAPFGSVDGRLALDAWRRLGPGAPARRIRQRVLRRGAVLATVVVGASLVLGSVLGAAVRTGGVSTTVVPQQPAPPTDYGTPTWPARPAPGQTAPQVRPRRAHPADRPAARPSARTPASRPSAPRRTAGTGVRTPRTAPGTGRTRGQGGGTPNPPNPAGGTVSVPGVQSPPPPRPSRTGGAVIGGLLGSDAIGGVPVLGMPGEGAPAPSGVA
ncbi:DoxX family membrane protein [Streptacidiphilus sp. ASG 303]|uniref:DoxX family membrane protein n=1 Tax=Streptacidiphilus sp. ASG 303 TaxID=2896847 RepID=UPI001E342531|nr:DoxX family membrane protein [Streptacidiphilus sp. ASG 303]MCD0486426.1 DoxX family membrane protein [Streptacidiphilus sp. ASG 303]